MRFKIIIILFLSLIITSCNLNRLRGNGSMDEISKDLDAFEGIDIDGSYNVKVYVGKSPSIIVKAEDNLIEFIETKIVNDILKISNTRQLSPTEDIELIITTNELAFLESSGANNISVNKITTKQFKLNFNGAGSIKLVGRAKDFVANISGAGSLDAKELKSQHVDISISGAASADVFALKSLDAVVSGVAAIDYYGNPEEIHKSVSGLATISQK
ncbi:MAG: DUF2807 domain-containing protein [Melioribacteraceae bacterium]|nr:DUF2807 domain-containing protein [Melioribacteraceae bacterium]